jgi:hypothetical protein
MRRFIPIVVLAVLLTGCKVKIDQGFEIKSDGSGSASVVFGFDDELMETMSSFSPDDDPLAQMETDLPGGWTSSDWSEGEFTGLEASTDFADLPELRSIASVVFSGEDGLFETFKIEETADGGFRFEATMSGESLEEGLQGVEGFDLGGSVDDLSETFFDAEINVKLPGEVTADNADAHQSDGTLVWKVRLTDSGRVISAESAPGGGMPIIPIAVGIAAAVAIAAAFTMMRNRSGGSVMANEEALAIPIAEPVGRPVAGDPFG